MFTNCNSYSSSVRSLCELYFSCKVKHRFGSGHLIRLNLYECGHGLKMSSPDLGARVNRIQYRDFSRPCNAPGTIEGAPPRKVQALVYKRYLLIDDMTIPARWVVLVVVLTVLFFLHKVLGETCVGFIDLSSLRSSEHCCFRLYEKSLDRS